MFWKFATTSNIDSLLEKEDVTLHDVMDDDDVLQECKGQNTKLVEFLCRPEVMDELVTLIITDPSGETDEALKYKYPNIACELLTSDVPQMNDMLGDTESLREKLFSFLDNDPVLNPLLASFFSKVVGILLSRKPEPTLEYIKTRNDFLGSVLKHLGTSAIMDLLLRLVTCVESAELRAQVLAWLNENKLVERLIGLIDPLVEDDFHCNSAQSLCDIIRLSREHMYTMQESAQDDPLLNTLERKETVQLLLQHMFDKGVNESVIINGISVLLALLEIRRPAPFGFPEMSPELTQLDVERLACGVSKTLHGLSDRLGDFHKLLESPPKRDVMNCTFGELNPPLGNTRLHVGKLLSAILITNTHNINVQLSELQIFNALLDLFFRYEYNNFLHTQVVQCIQTVLGNAVTVTMPPPSRTPTYSKESDSGTISEDQNKDEDEAENPRKVAPLLTHLFEDCRLIQRILDAWEENRIHETEACGHRKGYMGHLTLVTNHIIENMEKGTNAERIRQFIEGMPEEDQGRWQKFVAEPLSEMNEKNSRELGGHNPMHFSSDDDAEADYRDIPFTSGTAQQAFTDYQLQQITSNFIDQFGFTDGDFADQDEAENKFNKINSIDFDIKADANSPNQELFEDVCRARLPNFSDSSDDEEEHKFDEGEGADDWDLPSGNTDATYKYGSATPTITVRPRTSSGESTGSSSSDDDELHVSTHVKVPETAEEMDTSHASGLGWRETFEESDTSSSEGSGSNTPNTSPRVNTTPQEFEENLWTATPSVDVTTSSQTDNWANFDNMEGLSNKDIEIVQENRPALEHLERARAYAVADSTSDAENDDTNMSQPEPTRCENMEVGFASAPEDVSMATTSSGTPQAASCDVMMEVQEEAPKPSPSTSSDRADVDTGSDQTVIDNKAHTSEAVAMETDESAPAREETEAVDSSSEERSLSSSEPCTDGESAALCQEVSSTTFVSSEPPAHVDALVNEAAGEVEPSRQTENEVDSSPVVAHLRPAPSVDTNEDDSNTPETIACHSISESNQPDCAPAENGDSSAQVAVKQEGDLQNNEVTSSTVDTQPQMNGPV